MNFYVLFVSLSFLSNISARPIQKNPFILPEHPGVFVGYSCDEDIVYKTAISLVQSPECERTVNNTKVSNIEVAVTQTNTIGEVEYSTCFGMADHILTRCGKTIDQQVPGGLYSEIIKFNKTSCELLIQQCIFYARSGLNIPPVYSSGSGKIKESFTTIGAIAANGDCIPGGSISRNGVYHDRPIRNTKISITYKTAKARVDFDSKYIIFNNGIRCEYTKGSCYDTEFGFMYWKVDKPKCSEGRRHCNCLSVH